MAAPSPPPSKIISGYPVSTKVTDCSIQPGWILGTDSFAKNYMGSRPGPKTCDLFI